MTQDTNEGKDGGREGAAGTPTDVTEKKADDKIRWPNHPIVKSILKANAAREAREAEEAARATASKPSLTPEELAANAKYDASFIKANALIAENLAGLKTLMEDEKTGKAFDTVSKALEAVLDSTREFGEEYGHKIAAMQTVDVFKHPTKNNTYRIKEDDGTDLGQGATMFDTHTRVRELLQTLTYAADDKVHKVTLPKDLEKHIFSAAGTKEGIAAEDKALLDDSGRRSSMMMHNISALAEATDTLNYANHILTEAAKPKHSGIYAGHEQLIQEATTALNEVIIPGLAELPGNSTANLTAVTRLLTVEPKKRAHVAIERGVVNHAGVPAGELHSRSFVAQHEKRLAGNGFTSGQGAGI